MSKEKILQGIQDALRQRRLDGWLFYSFHSSDPSLLRIFKVKARGHETRRWFYYIPAEGPPVKIVHAIETATLDEMPGEKIVYLPWQQLHERLATALGSARSVAMQYSPQNALPYISRVDAGTVELVRSKGIEVVSSADLMQIFESVMTKDQKASHMEAAKAVRAIMERTLDELRRGAGEDSSLGEYEVQQRMVRSLEDMGLTTSNPPIVAVGPHSADPHFEPGPDRALPIRKGDLVMLDLWARKDEPGAIYADITWMAYMGDTVPDRYAAVFDVVRRARDAAFDYVRTSLEKGGAPLGWEADKAARTVIADAGYGDQFIHRTGHSLGEEVHGNGANLDNLETQDVRALIPGTCFTIEPGIYLSGDFGVRSEIDVIIEGRDAVITGGSAQQEIVPLLK